MKEDTYSPENSDWEKFVDQTKDNSSYSHRTPPENSEWDQFMKQTENNPAYDHLRNPASQIVRPVRHIREAIVDLVQGMIDHHEPEKK